MISRRENYSTLSNCRIKGSPFPITYLLISQTLQDKMQVHLNPEGKEEKDRQRNKQDTHLPLQLTVAIFPFTFSVSLAVTVSLAMAVSLSATLPVIVLVPVSAARLVPTVLFTRATVVPLPGPFPSAKGWKALKRIWNHMK